MMCVDTSDRISDLPGNITDNILKCLPIRDAVKTSILSKTWRYKWVTIPRLAFDDEFTKVLPGMSNPTREKLLLNIFQVLLRHRGSLHSFVLSVPELGSCPEIDQFILFLSGKEILNLHIQIKSGEAPVLPFCLFSCLQLRFLHLGCFTFKPPPTSFKGFSKLTVLQFCMVNFVADINNFIPECPLLEQLTLDKCINLDHLVVDAPNLKYFFFGGMLQSLCFKNTALLQTVKINTHKDAFSRSKQRRSSNFINIFSCLPSLEVLYASHSLFKFLAIGGIPDKLPTTLEHLRVLILHEICFGVVDEVSSALCLIKSSPNLQKLTIGVHGNAAADKALVLEVLEVQDIKEYSLNRLQRVYFNPFHGTYPELELVKLLLAASSVLEKMVIWPKKISAANEVVKILKELTRFPRASPIVEVLYKDSNVSYEVITITPPNVVGYHVF